MRPAAIYGAVFVWNAVTGGRFIAPYLQIAHHLTYSSLIGIIIASQFFITSLFSGWGGNIADSLERRYPSKGRINVLVGGITLGTCVSLIESTDFVSRMISFDFMLPFTMKDNRESGGKNLGNDFYGYLPLFLWHLCFRVVYAVAVSLTSPVLDGLTLAHLKREAGKHGTTYKHEGNKYGRERLHGAIWWGFGNVIIGYSIDQWGFSILGPFSVASTVVCYLMIMLYSLYQPDPENIEPENVSLLHDRQHHTHYDEIDESKTAETDDCTIESILDHIDKEDFSNKQKDVSDEEEISLWSLIHLLVA